jgi:hypothetical protein
MAWTPPSGKGFVERFCKVVGCSHMSGRPETVISRLKHVIGSRLRSHTDERRATEVGVAVQVLNRMLELGRPKYVRIA